MEGGQKGCWWWQGHSEGEDNAPGGQSAAGSDRGNGGGGDGDSDGNIPSVTLAAVCEESWRAPCTDQSLKWLCGHLLPSFTGRTGLRRCKLAW